MQKPLNMQYKDVVWLNGCFDVPHLGHIKLFQRARELIKCIKYFSPRYMLIGEEYKDKEIIGSEWIKEIIYVPHFQGLSSSNIINGTYKTPYL